ncbi:putative serine/threonine protein kinase [Aspergillus ibericus CBS 121593]|uniref:non-specific serine/threonine protein kinase n=1 Tax=Aspergillus ibericus CBS 121593 TaxID=1448316 RepID=A0A395GTF0_9EURO|nr:putative serine/threonine protein kinase [Aspergillus ibericus CBS 121593]RAK98805.1 putative serine/threonine protein kinase [Aspergillus ibericus CBS 121593]
MLHLTRRFTGYVLQRPSSPVRRFTQSVIRLNSSDKLEEETLPWYSPDQFYPVKIGETFRSRYLVVGKLGYGGYSTVWLCRDLQQHAHVALKIYERDSAHGERETEVYNHLKSVESDLTGSVLVRHTLDAFQISSGDSSHQCLVHPPLGMSLFELRNRARGKVLPENVVKPALIHILLALDFLHTDARVVHTDIQEKNIMLSVEDESILVDFEEAEKSDPSPRKVIGDRVIYSSRKLGIPKIHGRPILSDFGDARFISSLGTQWEDVQPWIYRAPEVVLRMPWDEKIDTWNVGVLAWDLFEQGHLFYARDAEKNASDAHHLAEMVAILGPPPKDILQRSEYASNFFDNEGNWKGAAKIPSISLEKLEGRLEGTHQEQFLCFLRKMLRWKPEDRASAKELLSDPWLKST